MGKTEDTQQDHTNEREGRSMYVNPPRGKRWLKIKENEKVGDEI